MKYRLPSTVDMVEFRREQYGLTARQWATILGTSPSHYSEFVNGKRGLTLAQAARAYEFGVPPDCLFQCKPNKGLRDIQMILKEQHHD